MTILFLALLNLLIFSNSDKDTQQRSGFIPPLKIPMLLSANFGELRADHFHSGIDIKTQGVTGKEVVATASGYIYRISVSPGGFGKALYMRHNSGYSTVYGHLDRFAPDIEKYVISRQYDEKSYMITIWPSKDKFHFNEGDIIGYSGNSGSSSGPHLHYEIRKSENEEPVNPLLFEFGVVDKFKPVIEKLAIYPVGNNSSVNGQNSTLKLSLAGSNGNYYVPSRYTISINGTAGFGVKSYDLLNSPNNKCSVFSIEMKIDSNIIYTYNMDAFRFDESRYINSHIDYETLISDREFFERAFILPNDRLEAYKNVVNRGVFNFNDDKKHKIEITVADINNNRSTLSFYVKGIPGKKEAVVSKVPEGSIMMPYGRNNKFTSGNVSVNIPSGALYDTLWFVFKKFEAARGMYSKIFGIHNKYTPLFKPYKLSIRPENIPTGKGTKLLIVQLTDDLKKIPLMTSWDNGWLTASPSNFGNFFIGIDTVPPAITPVGFNTGSDLKGRELIRIKVKDDLSGIKSYQPEIDGNWALFEYDQKNDLLIYKFDPDRIRKGTEHILNIVVSDNRDNSNTYSCKFIW